MKYVKAQAQSNSIHKMLELLTEEETASMIDVFKANDYLDGVIFISFGFQNLLWVKKMLI